MIQKIDNSKDGIEGAIYELVDSEGNIIAEITTDENGYGEVLYLTPGTYTLTEIYAPDGYYVDGDSYTIYLSEDDLGTTITYTVTDIVIEILPNAGSNTFFVYIGLCIALFGLLILLIRKSHNTYTEQIYASDENRILLENDNKNQINYWNISRSLGLKHLQ